MGIPFAVINDRSSLADWGLLLRHWEAEPPKVKEVMVELPGGDGAADLTEALGQVRYEMRQVRMEFALLPEKRAQWCMIREAFLKEVHGKKCDVELSAMPGWAFRGRCQVTEIKETPYVAVTVVMEAQPYQYRNQPTKVIAGNGTVGLYNAQKPVVPQVTCTHNARIAFGESYVELAPGSHRIPALQLKEGVTEVEVETEGTVTFTYEEGRL